MIGKERMNSNNTAIKGECAWGKSRGIKTTFNYKEEWKNVENE